MKKERIMQKAKKVLACGLVCSLMVPAHIVTAATPATWKVLNVENNEKVLYVGSTYTIKTTVKASKLKFTSKNTKVATVTKKGVVTTKKAGKAKIVIKNKKTKEKITLQLVVKKPTNFKVSKKSGTYQNKVRVKLKAKKGYTLYYTLKGKFKKSQKVNSGKTKTLTINKTKTLSVYVVKKGTKISAAKMNKTKKTYLYAAEYKYVIKKSSTSNTTENASQQDSDNGTNTSSTNATSSTNSNSTSATSSMELNATENTSTQETEPEPPTFPDGEEPPSIPGEQPSVPGEQPSVPGEMPTMPGEETTDNNEETTDNSENSTDNSENSTEEEITTEEETTPSAAEQNVVEKKKADKVAYTSLEDMEEALGEDGYTAIIIPDGSDVATVLSQIEGIEVNGTTVTFVNDGYYYLSGDLTGYTLNINIPTDENGDFTTENEGKVFITLDDVTLSSEDSAVINAISADKLILTLAEDSTTTLNGSSTYQVYDETTQAYVDAEADAALFSDCSMTINGTGTLVVNDKNGDAIKCKDTLRIISGTLNVTAGDDGITGKDKVAIFGGTVNVTSNGDGIKSSKESEGYVYIEGGDITVDSVLDAISAETTVYVTGGTINITTGDGYTSTEHSNSNGNDNFRPGFGNGNSSTTTEDVASSKGIKATTMVQIDAGEITLNCDDDAIHSNDTVRILGGNITIKTADDGIHADVTTRINGGTIDIQASYEGIEGYYIYQKDGTINLIASDDGMNAAGDTENATDAFINISGGSLTMNAQGDGMDSNGNITISGGTIRVDGPTDAGNGALDYYERGTCNITGGNLIFLSAYDQGMCQNVSSSSTQATVLCGGSTTYAAGSNIQIKDSNGTVLMSYTSAKAFAAIWFSCEEMEVGQSYSLYINDTLVKTISVTSTATSATTSNSNRPGGR